MTYYKLQKVRPKDQGIGIVRQMVAEGDNQRIDTVIDNGQVQLLLAFGKRSEKGFKVLHRSVIAASAPQPYSPGDFSAERADTVMRCAPGTVLKVSIRISTPQDRRYVVVDDALPAGFEIINTSFKTTGGNLATEAENTEFVDRQNEDQEENFWDALNESVVEDFCLHDDPFRHREMHDDRALFYADCLPAGSYTLEYFVRATGTGSFHMPGTHAEAMYEPEVFGQSGSQTVVIQPDRELTEK